MHIPWAIAVVLGIRQMGDILPNSYCTPECREFSPSRVTNRSARIFPLTSVSQQHAIKTQEDLTQQLPVSLTRALSTIAAVAKRVL